MSEPKPTREEMRAIGLEILAAIKPVLDKHGELELIFSYSLPREGRPGIRSTAFAHTFEQDPEEMFVRLALQLHTLRQDVDAGAESSVLVEV